MTRQEIYNEIEATFGLVPQFIKALSDNTLELEWKLFLASEFAEGEIPNKYRELAGIGIAAITHCKYCAYFHTAAAKLNGATDAEIEEAVHFAKNSAGWSTYLNGLQFDFDEFKKEVDEIVKFVNKKMAAA